MPKTGPGPIRRVLRKLFLSFVVVFALLALAEGTCSLLSFGYQFFLVPPVVTTERSHTQYDELLGWAHVPNTYIADLYGLGGYLKINSQGFRNAEDFSVTVPPGKTRVICSGDSFTLGYGVSNDQTWCQLLATQDKRLQTVNMGQGGYGVDQAYLWYGRDGVKLDHDIQLFAFITNDFSRSRSTSFRGYGKPLLRVRDGQLAVENVPVPRRHYYLPWLTEKLKDLEQLHLVQLLRLLTKRLQLVDPPDEASPDKIGPVIAAMFRSLNELNRQKHSTLVLVYLPMKVDLFSNEPDVWEEFVRAEAQRQGILFIDLIQEMKKLRHESRHYFLRNAHYSLTGNEVVARKILEKLLSFPETSAKILRSGAAGPPTPLPEGANPAQP